MEFSLNAPDAMETFNVDPFSNLLDDDDIPQDIFDDIMNDVNFGGIDMNSLSSEDSGRSSSSYDDTCSSNRIDSYMDSMSSSMNSFIKTEPETIQMHPTIPTNVAMAQANTATTIAQPILVKPTAIQQNSSPSQLIISQPANILIKQEPNIVVKQESPPNTTQQQIVTLQNIGGNFFMTGTTAIDQTPLRTIVNGSTGILTKIPIVPVNRLVQQPNIKTSSPSPVVLTPPHQTMHKSTMKESKKTGHNIIERRYRTSIVSVATSFLTAFLLKIKFSFSIIFRTTK